MGKQPDPSAYRRALLQRIRRYPDESFHLHTAGDAGRVLRTWMADIGRLQQVNGVDHYRNRIRRLGHELQWRSRRTLRRALRAAGLLTIVRSIRDKIFGLIKRT